MSVRIISVNVNGIRSASRKGFADWLRRQHADVVCLQETRAEQAQLPADITRMRSLPGHFLAAERKGYSGVALLCRRPPDRVVEGIGYAPFDREARYLQADFGTLSVASVYLPSGSSGEERQAFKMRCLARFMRHMKKLAASGRSCVVCGDFNIAHRKIDIENWRGNQKNSGFLPEERAWMDQLFTGAGWTDAFRVVDAKPRQYTWWSNRGRAWEKNVGWRLDYQVCTRDLAEGVEASSIYKRRRFSDHAPLTIDYRLRS